jgi:hypothetical protein
LTAAPVILRHATSALVLLAPFASLRWGEVSALTRADLDLKARTVRVRAAYVERSTGPLVLGPPKCRRAAASSASQPRSSPTSNSTWPFTSSPVRVRSCSPGSWAARCGAATSTSCRGGRTWSRRSACQGCTSTTCGTPAPVRRQQRGRAARPHGAHGPRLRAGRDDLPARGAAARTRRSPTPSTSTPMTSSARTTTGTTARPGCPWVPNGPLMARRVVRAAIRRKARSRKQLPTWPFV